MAVVVFGAYDFARACVPTLTTIDPQPQDMGRIAAEQVIAMMAQPQSGSVVAIQPVLQPGGSTQT
jgi:LacI family gluconate utilization system Gnt-I transcriptional repressor